MDHKITFAAGNDNARKRLAAIAELKEVVETDFGLAAEDLNGDGRPELIIAARSGMWCSDMGCPILVIENRPDKVWVIANLFTLESLAVTKESLYGYRALANVLDSGEIATDERPGSPNAGKPMVYPMEPPPSLVAPPR